MLSILIPAYNEADRVAETIEAARGLDPGDHPIEIVVVDDGSRDDTAQRAEQAGADIVFRQPNQGKGAALNRALTLSRGELLLLLDADLGVSAIEAGKLLPSILVDEADMTIATFPVIPGRGGGSGRVVRLARQGIHDLTGREMAAPLSGQRALWRTVVEKSGGFAGGWGAEVALTVRALRSGFRVVEIPTEMTHRVTGRKLRDIWHRARQYQAAARALRELRRELGPESGSSAEGQD